MNRSDHIAARPRDVQLDHGPLRAQSVTDGLDQPVDALPGSGRNSHRAGRGRSETGRVGPTIGLVENQQLRPVTAADLGVTAVGWAGAGQKITSVTAAEARQAGEVVEDDGETYTKVVAFLENLKVI